MQQKVSMQQLLQAIAATTPRAATEQRESTIKTIKEEINKNLAVDQPLVNWTDILHIRTEAIASDLVAKSDYTHRLTEAGQEKLKALQLQKEPALA